MTVDANGFVAVIGDGALAPLVCRQLSAQCEVARQRQFTTRLPEAAQLAVVVHDDWDAADRLKVEEALRQAGIPTLYGFVTDGEAVVGPLVRPGKPGCSLCADYRRRVSAEMQERLMSRLLTPEAQPPDDRPSQAGLRHAALLFAAEAVAVLQGGRARTEDHLYTVHLTTLASARHYILPNPLCPVCGGVDDDSPEAARIALKPNPKPDEGSYRCRSMRDFAHISGEYLDARTGLFNEKWHHLASAFANVAVNWPSPLGDEITGGKSHSYAECERIAIMEGLERYCGLAPRGKRTVVRECFRDVAAHALDPVSVGVYAPEQYAQPDFPYAPFDRDRPIDWVWGYSCQQQRPILVPEQLAYYSLDYGSGFVRETSNGCALGASVEEAVLHGILEVVERDSFLMTWYAKLPVPRLDPASAADAELLLMIERLRAVAGYDVYLFNTTMENGIPSIWALAKNRAVSGANIACAAGAHPDPVRAAKSAIHELDNTLLMLQHSFEPNREEAERMIDDSSLVREMSDHSILYGLPQAEERLRFLLEGDRPLRTFGESFKPRAKHADLTDDLKDMLQTFRQLNLDVVAVDQSSPETLRAGLHCVKVLIPGMIPMSFGHHLARLAHLPRLLRVPAELGFTERPLTPRQLNPFPHPFP